MADDLPSRIRAAIAYSGRDRDDIASQLDISPTTLWRSAEGKRVPRGPELAALAQATGVPLEWLTHGFPDPDADLHERIDYLEKALAEAQARRERPNQT